jgi:phenylacetate-coenzyme A ligase PaaK-like adenylate-forming protein
MFQLLKQQQQSRACKHLESREAVLEEQKNNFSRQLKKLSDQKYNQWFGNVRVSELADLAQTQSHSNKQLLETQKNDPPYGMLNPGQLVFSSSGSTGQERPYWYHNWDDWCEFNISASRSLMSYNVGANDRIVTTDVGSHQIGYRHFEDAATITCGAQLFKSGSTSWHEKLNLIERNQITVLVANTTKLKRMAALIKSAKQVQSLRLIVQIGQQLSDDDRKHIQEKFLVHDVLNGYGNVEMSQIAFSCPAGKMHVHDDLFYAIDLGTHSLFTRLVGSPAFNIESEERIMFSYKGRCECGSYLSTVDQLITRNICSNQKE